MYVRQDILEGDGEARTPGRKKDLRRRKTLTFPQSEAHGLPAPPPHAITLHGGLAECRGSVRSQEESIGSPCILRGSGEPACHERLPLPHIPLPHNSITGFAAAESLHLHRRGV